MTGEPSGPGTLQVTLYGRSPPSRLVHARAAETVHAADTISDLRPIDTDPVTERQTGALRDDEDVAGN